MALTWLSLAGLMMLAAILTVLYVAIVPDPVIDTAKPEKPETTFEPESKIRYPVPLDDDLQAYIVRLCAEKELAPSVIFAQIGVESKYQADIIGDNGNSFGLMQIYKSCHEDRMLRLGVSDLLDPVENVTVGIDIMAELMDMGNGIEWALSYYNGHGGAPCEYARTVLCNAEQIMEGVQVVQN